MNTRELRRGVTLNGILEHERALQDIAIANDGNRAATSAGYDASVDYVETRLKRAGYQVTRDEFEFADFELTSSSITGGPGGPWAEDTDYIVSQFSGAASNLTAPVVPVGPISIPPSEAGASTSGCDPATIPDLTGKIALIQRGTCAFVDKYANAKAKGAVAVLIFNDGVASGQDPREDPLFITAPTFFGIPAIMISNARGEALYNAAQSGTVELTINVDATTTPVPQYNVVADSPRGNKGRTIVVGAHLDSVEAGPGINDNGSGTATILEIAEEIAQLDNRPRNRLRFAFWGAEEAGLVGSNAYVAEQIENGGIDQIEANLNFDMVGSPNFVRFVYDGDLSDSAPPPGGAPAGSAQIERVFTRYFDRQGLQHDPTAFDGRSDYGPFIAADAGVPAGGLFTGAEGIKTEDQENRFGGVAGLAYDPCYHQACDTFFNLSHVALDQMSDAAAHATWTLARSQSPVASATAAKAKKGKKAKRGRAFKFKGHQRLR